jgi:hypothetical protein
VAYCAFKSKIGTRTQAPFKSWLVCLKSRL